MKLAEAGNTFAFELWARTRETPGNLAISPASIAIALAMTCGGARGKTEKQMRSVLHLDGEVGAWGALSAELQNPKREIELRIANRLFGERSMQLEQAFLEATAAAFGAPLEPVDFLGAAEAARARINTWVEQQTNDRIKNLLPPSSLTPDTRLVLVNAIYFLAKWAEAFSPHATRDATFFVTKTEQKQVAMMCQLEHFRYARVADAAIVELPYTGGDTAMVVIVPEAIDGLDALERSLDASTLAKWTRKLSSQSVLVSLPRFTIDPPEPIALADVLAALGMPLAFDRVHADFTGIAKPANPDEALSISKVFHKAFVKVDEAGTEAAAATAVVMVARGGAPKKHAELRADRPFLFAIVDKRSGLILFLGRVVDPQA